MIFNIPKEKHAKIISIIFRISEISQKNAMYK